MASTIVYARRVAFEFHESFQISVESCDNATFLKAIEKALDDMVTVSSENQR